MSEKYDVAMYFLLAVSIEITFIGILIRVIFPKIHLRLNPELIRTNSEEREVPVFYKKLVGTISFLLVAPTLILFEEMSGRDIDKIGFIILFIFTVCFAFYAGYVMTDEDFEAGMYSQIKKKRVKNALKSSGS